jgi:hypothetical protein
MSVKRTGPAGRGPARGLGGLLVLAGVLLLLGQALDVDLAGLWPLAVVLPGVVLAGLGLTLTGRPGQALTVAGGVVTGVGLLLLYQNATGHWESWAYAWTLAVPFAAGTSLWLHGAVSGRKDAARRGRRLALGGLAAFAVLAVFFELIVGLSGGEVANLRGWVLPLLLIGVGLLVLLRGARRRRES